MLSFTLPSIFTGIVLLGVRIIVALAFYHESRAKLKDIKGFANSHGLSEPVTYIVAVAELMAAISMFLGVLSQWAGVGIILLMTGTLWMHLAKWKSPYWAQQKGWEYDIVMIVLAGVIIVFGPGALTF